MAIKKVSAGEDAKALDNLQNIFKQLELPVMETTVPRMGDKEMMRFDHVAENEERLKEMLQALQDNRHNLHLIAFRNFLAASRAIQSSAGTFVVMPRLYPLSVITDSHTKATDTTSLKSAFLSLVAIVRLINEHGFSHRDLHKGNLLVYQDPTRILHDWDGELQEFNANDYFTIIPIDFGLMSRIGEPINIINVTLATAHARSRTVCHRCDIKALLLFKRDLFGAQSVVDELLQRADECGVSFEEVVV